MEKITSQIYQIKNNKEQLLDLLLIADPSEEMIRRYLTDGELFVMEYQKEITCAAVIYPLSDNRIELKNLVTHPQHLRKGAATKMLCFLLEHYRNASAMLIGTGSTGKDDADFFQVDFYKKCGFIHSHTIRNYFVDHYPDPIYEEDGRQCVDMIYLIHPLNNQSVNLPKI